MNRIDFADLNPQVKVAALVALITGMNESGQLPDAILSAALSRHGITPEVIANEINKLGEETSAEFKQFEQFFSDNNIRTVDWLGANECEWIEPIHASDYIQGQQTLIFDMYAVATVLPHHYFEDNLAKQFSEGWVILFPDAVYGLPATTIKESPIYRNQEQAMEAVMKVVYSKFNRDAKGNV